MNEKKIQETMRSYLRWPLLLSLLLIAVNLHMYTLDVKIGALMTIYVILYIAIALLLFFYKRKALLGDLVQYAIRFNRTVNRLASNLDLPLAITDWTGSCLWCNWQFTKLFCTGSTRRKFTIDSVIPNLSVKTYPQTDRKSVV